MYNTMNGVNVADKLKLDPEVRELKFGSSFTSGGRNQQQGSFHSVRYDFKPASVDTSKMATLDVGPNGQVTISMPNVDGNGTTVFKGARKPYAKECVLIIDHETGEVVLEKLTHNIQVKRTREEGGCKKGGSSSLSMPVVPPPPAVEAKKPPHPSSFKMDPKITNNRERDDSKKPLLSVPSTSQMQHQHQQPNANKRGPNNSPKPPPPQQRQSPNNRPSPGHSVSPPLALSPPSPHPTPAYDSHRSNLSKQSQSQQNSILSLTNFEDLLSMAPPPPQAKAKVDKPLPPPPPPQKEIIPNISAAMHQPKVVSPVAAKSNNVSALSESSSGEDSSSSSSSDEDDDSSDDMEDVPDKVPIPALEISQPPPVINSNRGRPHAVAPSMPTDLLCEDLQLSESGSDSE